MCKENELSHYEISNEAASGVLTRMFMITVLPMFALDLKCNQNYMAQIHGKF